MILNLKDVWPFTIDTQCSQIDLYPTLFSLMNWNYNSNFFGRDVLAFGYKPRAFVGTYQKLGYLENDRLVVLSPKKAFNCYHWEKANNNAQTAISPDSELLHRGVSYYESAALLFKDGS
jgi:phosphoglycerol transferase MdoB-like AlkP superfamily enzyme